MKILELIRPLSFAIFFIFFFTIGHIAVVTRAGDLLIFAAASTKEVVEIAASKFLIQTGSRVRTVFAASSILAKQIKNGAPADIFLSANPIWMDYLSNNGQILKGSRQDLLTNTLVLAILRSKNLKQGENLREDVISALGNERLALGDPDHVPSGIYARQALKTLGLWEYVEDRLIRTANVRMVVQMVLRGEAPLGVIYETDAYAYSKQIGIFSKIDTINHQAIRYPIAVIEGNNIVDARQFIEFFSGPAMAEILKERGFGVP